MARKKVSKKAKTTKATRRSTTTAKRAPKSNANTLTLALEKSFKETPNKLITLGNKELSGLKQQEKKLLAEIKKAQTQKQTIQKQNATTTAKHKSKPSAATKKQLATHKISLEKNAKNLTGLNTQLAQLKLDIKGSSSKQSKLAALNKLLTSFDKEWEAKSRTAAAAKPKPRTRKKTAKNQSTTNQTTTANQDNNNYEPNLHTEDDLETIE